MSTSPADESAQTDISRADASFVDPVLAASQSPETSLSTGTSMPAATHDDGALHDDGVADAMKDQLRKDVASWREGRAEGSGRQATELSVAVTRSIVPPTNARMKRAKPAPVEAKPATTEKKPFGMSYDGTSRADYIKLMISRGAR